MDALQDFLAWLAAKEDTPYLWGGRGTRMTLPPVGSSEPPPPDPDGLYPSPYEGYDCFGFPACGLLEVGGPDLRGWWTDRAWAELPRVATPEPGCLVFYAPAQPSGPQDVEHVEVVVGPGTAICLAGDQQGLPGWRTIGARGGNHLTTSARMAESQGARVQYRPNHLLRPRVAGFCRLPLPGQK